MRSPRFKIPRALACAAAFTWLVAAPAAHAANYDFSYQFSDGSLLTGTLSGDLSGQFLNNVSDVHVSLNGTAFTGATLFSAAWNTTIQDWDSTLAPRISTNAALNNFIIADSNVPTDFGASNYVYFVNDDSGDMGHQTFATNLNTGDAAFDSPINNSWSLVAAPVPEADGVVLALAGLGLLGAVVRRRAR